MPVINREQIEKRLAQLRAEQEQMRANLVQLQANLSAYEGAIQDCEYWLEILKVDEAQPKPAQ